MSTHRRYTKQQKMAAVLAAEFSGVTEAGKQTGIPKQTIQYWLERPEFVQLRTKAREELADEIKVVAHLAWMRAAEALQANTLEPRDVLFIAEKATEKHLLMSGEATARNESRDLTDDLSADEKRALRERYAELARREAGGSGAGDALAQDSETGAATPTG